MGVGSLLGGCERADGVVEEVLAVLVLSLFRSFVLVAADAVDMVQLF